MESKQFYYSTVEMNCCLLHDVFKRVLESSFYSLCIVDETTANKVHLPSLVLSKKYIYKKMYNECPHFKFKCKYFIVKLSQNIATYIFLHHVLPKHFKSVLYQAVLY